MTLTHVLTPLRIAGTEIRNRVVRAAHSSNLSSGGVISDDLIAYHVARGRGGVGMSIVENMAIHWTSPLSGSPNIVAPGAGDSIRKLVDAVRPTGMKLFQQIWHGGQIGSPKDGSPPWSASDLHRLGFAGLLVGEPSIPMTKAMIDEIITAFGDAARACEHFGLDGLELHAAHSCLPAQFLSPACSSSRGRGALGVSGIFRMNPRRAPRP